MKHIRWNDVPVEQLTKLATRQVLHTERMTLVRLVLRRGAVVTLHSHENEQISTVVNGTLRFELGDGSGDNKVVTLHAGESLAIPPHLPHSVTAEEDTEVTDVFSPRREDWIRGDDAYLR